MKGVVASVMHTGTWFTFEVIKRLTGEVVMPWRHTFAPNNPSDCQWLHMHVNEDPWSDVRYIRQMLLEAFVERAEYPTIIPLRDPVLALISRHLRREQDHVPLNVPLFEMVDGFCRLARWYRQGLGDVFWFPVDLHEDWIERGVLLGALTRFIGRDVNLPAVADLGKEWPIRNATHALSTLKKRYLAGDVAAVEAVLPAEMEELRRRPQVAAMFEDLGYTLSWVRA